MNCRRRFGLLLLFLFAPLPGLSQENPRLLVRGQEIVIANWAIKDNRPYLNAADPSLSRIADLLGGSIIYDSQARRMMIAHAEKQSAILSPDGMTMDDKVVPFDFPPLYTEYHGDTFVSLHALAKACGASLTFDSDKNIWYMDPFLTAVSIKSEDKQLNFTLNGSGPMQPGATRFSYPDRLVVDLPYTALSPTIQVSQFVPNALAKAIKLGQFQSKPSIVRLVITLQTPEIQWEIQGHPEESRFSLLVTPQPPVQYRLPSPGASEQPPPQVPAGPAKLVDLVTKTEKKGAGESLSVTLKLDRSTSYQWRRLKDSKNRFFVDLKNCFPEIKKGPVYQTTLVSDIRVGEFQKQPEPITRIVFDLTGDYSAQTNSTHDGLEVVISSEAASSAEASSGEGETGGLGLLGSPSGEGQLKQPAHPNGIVIAIDPGHGGSDPGAYGKSSVEKNMTLDIALRLRDLLVADGFAVVMTRTSDMDVLGYHGEAKAELQARVNVAERARAAIFISVHINSAVVSWPHGIETHWYKAMDLPLANVIQRHLDGESGFEDRGVLRNRYYVLRSASMPAVLEELGFLSNSEDEAKLSQREVRQKLAEALKEGIEDYTHVH